VTAVSTVGEAELGELLPLMRGYADFYEVSPSDEALLELSRALIADARAQAVYDRIGGRREEWVDYSLDA
jgi:hypothetical protein